MTEVEKGIIEIINATGEPVLPPEQGHRAYGLMDGNRMGTETAAAIKVACDAVIAEHYRAVENLENMAKQSRASVDAFAEKLRGYSDGFTGHITDFLSYAQRASDQAAASSAEFEEKIAKLIYPRANGNRS